MHVYYVCVRNESMHIPPYLHQTSQANYLHVCGQTPTDRKTSTLTFDRMQNSIVQGLAAWVIGGRADACSTTVGQSVPDTPKHRAQNRGKQK